MRPLQIFLILVGTLILVAIALTIATAVNAPSVATDPFAAWAWWHSGVGLAAMAIWMLLFWVLVVGGIVWLIAALRPREAPAVRETPLEILRQRYARGEINREEYERMRHELE